MCCLSLLSFLPSLLSFFVFLSLFHLQLSVAFLQRMEECSEVREGVEGDGGKREREGRVCLCLYRTSLGFVMGTWQG